MRRRSATVATALVVGVFFWSCGEDDQRDEAELPERLAEVVPRLEGAGYQVEAVDLGRLERIPGLLITDEGAAVVLAIGAGVGGPHTSLSTPVEDSSGNEFETSIETICSDRDVYVAAKKGSRTETKRVLQITRLC